jgi:hypothetical protein
MKSKSLKYIFALLLCQFFYSCIEVDEQLQTANAKLAVIALLSPSDSLVAAFVSVVNPLNKEFNVSESVPRNAKVSIISGGKKIILPFVDSTQRYQLFDKGFIKFNNQYELLVEVNGYNSVHSSCNMLKEIIPTASISNDDKKVTFTIKWKDTPIETNAYSVYVRYWNQQVRSISFSGVIWNNSIGSSFNVSDVNLSNPEITAIGNLTKSKSISDTTTFFVNFTNIDQQTSTFLSKRSSQYNQNESNQQSISDFISDVSNKQADLNSFFERFKEPVLLPTNIENGLGYFGGYSRKIVKIPK